MGRREGVGGELIQDNFFSKSALLFVFLSWQPVANKMTNLKNSGACDSCLIS